MNSYLGRAVVTPVIDVVLDHVETVELTFTDGGEGTKT